MFQLNIKFSTNIPAGERVSPCTSACTMKCMTVLKLFSYALFLTILLSSPATSVASSAMRADLTHVDSGRGFTRWELLSRMKARSRARVACLHQRGGHYGHPATASVAPGTVGEVGTEYLIHFGIGTPRPQHVALTLDTGSDLVWTQCNSCQVCFNQPSPLFDPSASKTLYGVPCSDPICEGSSVSACYIDNQGCFYLDSYGDNSITAGMILRDTFTFKGANGKGGTVVVPNLSFGCGLYNTGVYNTNESGIAGFGRGPQSLPSQLKVGKFSHCFTSMFDSNKSSAVFLGTPDDLRAHATGPIQSTPMKQNRVSPNNYYYLSLKGITVGETRLPINESAFALKKDGSGGTIIDSGTGVTTFPQAVYEQLRSAFVAQVPLPAVNSSEDDLCFSVASVADAKKVYVPKLVFHLEGADMDLPRENYMAVVNGSLCLVISGGVRELTLIGNFQQQNIHIVYDVENNKLLFVPAQCDKL
ncbi:aspartic proteinase nepenthesin-1-like [Phragmites australis]|uniref:aspartic proteinase nepenthesin-1-like n=1 Tax=Phragmites australis TaxID=29695 RepID=UPI002D795E3A|nr:aspartic proteinase nepenthesin-1-like [Phragmites australis]